MMTRLLIPKPLFRSLAAVVLFLSLSHTANVWAEGDAAGNEDDPEWKTMSSERGIGRRRSRPSAPSIQIDSDKKILVTEKIKFVSKGDEPTPVSLQTLKRMAAFLAKNPEVSLRIEGHADSIGADQANLEISQRRADRVKEVLVQEGVATERLQAVGMGDKYPIASDTTPAGQERNRRVEFHVSEAAAAPIAATPPPPAPEVPPPPPPPVISTPETGSYAPVPVAPVPSPVPLAPSPPTPTSPSIPSMPPVVSTPIAPIPIAPPTPSPLPSVP